MGSGVIIGKTGFVGNGVGIMVAGINVDVGMDVDEIRVGIGISIGTAAVCLPQATRNTRRIT